MEKKVRSEKFLRKRKMLMMLPVLVVPFLTMAFWGLGGGTGAESKIAGKEEKGLNIELPSAEVKEEENATKLSFYEKAEALQKEREKQIQNDPYFRLMNQDETTVEGPDAEEKVLEKISLLEKEINKPAVSQREFPEYNPKPVHHQKMTEDVERLEQLMRLMSEKEEDDPEMRQLDTMLEKIMDVQHPERVRERLTARIREEETPVFEVKSSDEVKREFGRGFYSLENTAAGEIQTNSIEAAVHESQTLVNGAVVKLRLLEDVVLDSKLIPKGNFVYGFANLNGERLHVKIESIRFENYLFPVKMEVYDMDGLRGIYIPGAITRDVAKQSADNSLRQIEPGIISNSFGAQLAAAGITTTKNFLSKKVKLVRVTVKAGYRLLLRNEKI
jgi:conjugative transposon TraM protein